MYVLVSLVSPPKQHLKDRYQAYIEKSVYNKLYRRVVHPNKRETHDHYFECGLSDRTTI